MNKPPTLKAEGSNKEATEQQADEIQERADKVDEALDELKSAEPLEWKSKMPDVEAAKARLLELIQA